MRTRYHLVVLFLVANCKIFSQEVAPDKADSTCPQKDAVDVLRQWMGKPIKPVKLGTLILVPIIGSNPAQGFSIGAGGQYAFRRKEEGSLYSLMSASVTVTTKKQLIVQIKNNVYTKNNKFFLSGDWRFLVYSQPTYGLSTRAPDGSILDYQNVINGIQVHDDSLVQPMQFNHVRFYQTVSMNLAKSVYVGIGYHLDYHFNIIDQKLDTATHALTSHYIYSKHYGFNPHEYLLSGLSINFVADTRDNMINPYKGFFANVNYKFYPAFLGNAKTANSLLLEWRSFHGLSARNPRHLIGFWLLGAFSPVGDLPYLDLPALGYDQRGRSGRGYTQGRYRGPDLLYGETEYRFPISQCGGVLGGVVFVNATTANSPDKRIKLFDYIEPAYGFGLRIMVDKHSRTNLQVDYGFGHHSSGFYLGATEVF